MAVKCVLCERRFVADGANHCETCIRVIAKEVEKLARVGVWLALDKMQQEVMVGV